jgi:outer membrane protein TolC
MSLLCVVLASRAFAQPPEPPVPDPDTPPRPPAEAVAPSAGPTPGAHTLSLGAAVTLALERNFGLLSSADALASARFREGAAEAQFYPKLTPSYARAGPDDQIFRLEAAQRLPWSGASLTAAARVASSPAAEGPATRGANLSLILTQPLLRGLGPTATYFDLENSRRSRQGQERAFELARQRLVVDVASAFYQVVRQRQLLTVARQSDERSRKLRDASESRMRVGLASKLDVLRADLQASQAQEAMVSFQAALDSGLESFRVLLGLRPDEAVEPEETTLAEQLVAEVEPIEALVARALRDRLELHETRDQVKDAERAASLARQNLLPQLDVQLAVTQNGYGTSLSDAFSDLRPTNRTVRLGLATSYPLDRSTEKANRAVAELELAARRRALVQREFEVEAEVRAAMRNLERIGKSVELQRKGVVFAEQQHRLATLRYQRGLASNFDVVDAEGSLVAARTALVGLSTDYEVARVQLKRASGALDAAQAFAP